MTSTNYPSSLNALSATARQTRSIYPEPFATRMNGRIKTVLSDLFGLNNFGVNLTRLKPGGISALRHCHTVQDEFIYILEGRPTLHDNNGSVVLEPGMCAGNRAGSKNAQQLENTSNEDVLYLEIGDRLPNDSASYPDDDIKAEMGKEGWHFSHKDGTPY